MGSTSSQSIRCRVRTSLQGDRIRWATSPTTATREARSNVVPPPPSLPLPLGELTLGGVIGTERKETGEDEADQERQQDESAVYHLAE
jgi:hypothetical protein